MHTANYGKLSFMSITFQGANPRRSACFSLPSAAYYDAKATHADERAPILEPRKACNTSHCRQADADRAEPRSHTKSLNFDPHQGLG